MELESISLQGSHLVDPRKILVTKEQDMPDTGTDVLTYLANEGHAGLSSGDLAEL